MSSDSYFAALALALSLLPSGALANVGSQDDLALRQNEEILAECAFDRGEGLFRALEAYLRLGRLYAAREDWELAEAYFETAIEEALPASLPLWARALDVADVERRWRFVERAMAGLIEARMARGELESARRAALEFLNAKERLRFSFSGPGQLSLLAAAEALSVAGGVIGDDGRCGVVRWYPDVEAAVRDGIRWKDCLSGPALAVQLVLWVRAENPESSLRPRCEKLIAEIARCPGALIDPAPLYAVACVKYDEQESGEVVTILKRVLSLLARTDPLTYRDYAPPTYFYLGRSYQRLDRHLEAAMAFREGHFTSPGNETWDSYNETGFYRSAEELLRAAPADPLLKSLFDEAERVAAVLYGHDQRGLIAFLTAERARTIHQDFMAALRHYREVPPSSDYYVAAQVYIGVCKYHIAQPDLALGFLLPHLEDHVLDAFELEEDFIFDEEGLETAKATAELYRALIEYERTDYPAVIEHAWDFHLAYPQEKELAPRAMRMVARSLIRTGHLDDGRRYLELASRIYGAEPREE